MNKVKDKIDVSIWRGKASQQRSDGQFHEYKVERRDNQTILDVVTEIQRHQEPSLAYRFACRVGVCGSCAMTVNGVPRWTCRTHVSTVLAASKQLRLQIEPLRNLPVIKDLACDMEPFFRKWQKAGAQFEGTATRHDPIASIKPDSEARIAADEAIECINCAVCYSACDVVAWNDDYAGPAALNRIWSLVNDARQSDRSAVLDTAFTEGLCSSCHSHGNCTRHCPVELNPSRSVASLKKAALFGVPDTQD